MPGRSSLPSLLYQIFSVMVAIARDELTRIISARKATKYEQRIYFEQLSD